MEYIIAFVVGGVVAAVGMVAAMRRAAKKPNGKTAKAINALFGGGGGGPKENA